MSDPTEPTRSSGPETPDTIAAFVDDLGSLRRDKGNVGVKALATRMNLSHGSIHAALTKRDRLPSEYVIQRMVSYWSPDQLSVWLDRREALSRGDVGAPEVLPVHDTPLPPSHVDASAPEPVGTAPTCVGPPQESVVLAPSHRARLWHWTRVMSVYALVAALSCLTTAPLKVGGVDVVRYCRENYPRWDGSQGQIGTDFFDGWRCRKDDGQLVPVDMTTACRQQHPAIGPFGRTFADHVDQSSASWRCYLALIAFP